jgi:Phosphoglycerol transferase and related proteins, alkaline phosphatase superfamily
VCGKTEYYMSETEKKIIENPEAEEKDAKLTEEETSEAKPTEAEVSGTKPIGNDNASGANNAETDRAEQPSAEDDEKKRNGFSAAFHRIIHKKPFCYSIVQIMILAIVMNLITDSFSRFSVLKAFAFMFMHPLIFLVNAMIIAIFLAPAILFRRRGFFYAFGCILWLAVAVIDFVVLHNRVTPFNANDFRMLDDAWNVLFKYYNLFQVIGLGLLILIGVLLVVVAFIKFPKQSEPVQYRYALPLCLSIIFGCMLLCIGSRRVGLMAKTFPNIANAYHDYGLPYCFVCSILDKGIDKPSDYSRDRVKKVVEQISSPSTTPSPSGEPGTVTPTPALNAKNPNIIFIQLESFFDPKRIRGLDFATDPIPTFTYLRKNYTSGLLGVPSISAGTSNTEFEVLTGMNMADFGTGEYPYKTILREKTCESIAFNLKELGYGAHAIHNNTAAFYSRHIVYSNLGFDDFDTIEMMENIERNELGWARDAVLYDEILVALDTTPGTDLVFTVSVQGHGKYPDEDILENAIELTDVMDAYGDSTINGLKYYINQLHEMDNLIARLIEKFQNSEEPTVLVLYGDHLPGFNFKQENLNEGTLLQTEYVIWTNFDLAVEHHDLEAYQLSAYLLNRLGFHNGMITKLHQSHMFLADQSDYLHNLSLLSYDMLYGEQFLWDGEIPYEATKLTFGFHPVTLSSYHTIYSLANDTYYLQLFGEHFTPYTDIYINGTRHRETIVVSDTEIFLPAISLKEGDVISVAMPIDDTMTLRESNPLVFTPEDYSETK